VGLRKLVQKLLDVRFEAAKWQSTLLRKLIEIRCGHQTLGVSMFANEEHLSTWFRGNSVHGSQAQGAKDKTSDLFRRHTHDGISMTRECE
jgi:hypothetical protein